MLVIGIIGGLWNILTLRHYSFRSSSYCIYMLIGSIAALIHISFSLTDRIFDKGFKIHWTANNNAWCKIRYYIAHCSSLIALSCLTFSVIDRFLSTCREIKWRRLSSTFAARQVCLIIISFWMLVNIPNLVYLKTTPVTSNRNLCTNTSSIWSNVMDYFIYLCCYAIFPWFFMSLFGCLTLRNIRYTRHHRVGVMPPTLLSRMARIDDQLASMLFLQIIVSIVASIPHGVQFIYDHLTEKIIKDDYRLAQEYLFLQVSRLIFHFNYISMFYVNYISSLLFRQLSKRVLINLFKKHDDISRDITIVNHQEITIQDNKRTYRR